jgi:hypothetical protein
VRRLSRNVLARDATARIRPAACKEQSRLWTAAEAAHEAASTAGEAELAAAPALQFCADCPVMGVCAQWAEVDEYTGLAAGQAWVNGKPRPAYRARNLRVPLAS